MHPLEALRESELAGLSRITERLLYAHQLLAPGHRSNRQKAGSGIEFLDFREFCVGDDSRNIDWRITARSSNPQIRRYSNEVSADWYIALDCSASMAVDDGIKWARAEQCAAAIAYLLLQQDNRVSILLFGERIHKLIPLGRGSLHYASILQTLRNMSPPQSGGGSDLHCCVGHIKRFSPVFIISDFLAQDGMKKGLQDLSLWGDRIHALQILSDWDYRIPAHSAIRIRDVESGESIFTDVTITQENFRKRLDSFCISISDFCKKHRIQFSHHSTDKDWKSILLNHLHSWKNYP